MYNVNIHIHKSGRFIDPDDTVVVLGKRKPAGGLLLRKLQLDNITVILKYQHCVSLWKRCCLQSLLSFEKNQIICSFKLT